MCIRDSRRACCGTNSCCGNQYDLLCQQLGGCNDCTDTETYSVDCGYETCTPDERPAWSCTGTFPLTSCSYSCVDDPSCTGGTTTTTTTTTTSVETTTTIDGGTTTTTIPECTTDNECPYCYQECKDGYCYDFRPDIAGSCKYYDYCENGFIPGTSDPCPECGNPGINPGDICNNDYCFNVEEILCRDVTARCHVKITC